jgi:hypothetical protein
LFHLFFLVLGGGGGGLADLAFWISGDLGVILYWEVGFPSRPALLIVRFSVTLHLVPSGALKVSV